MLDLTDEREDWLIFETRNLIKECGSEAYLLGAIIEPNPRYFPESWAPDLEGAIAVTKKLLGYAGLADHVVHFTSYSLYDAEADHEDEGAATVAGWFSGIEKGVALFGINTGKLHDPEALAGVMAHEVAHAFRNASGVVSDDHDVEEQLTDLTCVYLGFGILSTNIRERTIVEQDPWTTIFRQSQVGYLSVDDFCFLLALQVVVRGADVATTERVARFLSPGQRVAFRAAVDDLRPDRAEMVERLGLTPSTAAPKPLPQIPTPAVSDPKRWSRPWGHVAYRAKTFGLRQGLGWIAGIAYFGGFVVLMAFGLSGRVVLELATAIIVATAVFAGLRGIHRCSRCNIKLAPNAEECPHCASLLIATLADPPARFGTGENRGRRVFRVRASRAGTYGTLAGGAALLVVGIVIAESNADPLPLFACPIAATVAGGLLGKQRRVDLCSSNGCDTQLPPGLTECPRCLGEIHGEIDAAKDRLQADEDAARRTST